MSQDRMLDLLVILGTALGSRARAQTLVTVMDAGVVESVSELARRMKMPLSTVSHHVGVLTACGFVVKEREGRDASLRVRDDVEAMLEHVLAWAGESEEEGDVDGR